MIGVFGGGNERLGYKLYAGMVAVFFVVTILITVFNASLYLTQSLATYFFKYDIGNYSLYGLFATVGGASQILSMMTFPLFRKKMETKKVLLMAIVITIVGYVGLFLASLLSIAESIKLVLLCIIGIVIFFGFGLAFSIIFFMKNYILTEDKLNEITRELGGRR